MKKKLFAILLSLVMILSSVSYLSEVSFAEGEKAFIVTEKALGADDSTAMLVGEFDTLKGAINACKLGFQDSKEYIITLTNDYNVGINEKVDTINSRNITIKSKGNNKFKITANTFNGRIRYMFAVESESKVTFENIILDGNNQNPFIEIQNASGIMATVTIGSGVVIQNFKVMVEEGPSYSQPFMVNGKLIIEDGAIIQNNKNDSKQGYGVIYTTDGEITINGGVIKNNYSAKYGGLIMAFSNAKVTINGGTFEGNKSGSQAGVIYSNGILNINGGTFEGNKSDHSGGAIAVGSRAALNVSGGTFKGNIANFGSAIYTSNAKNVEIKNAAIEGNASGFGAVYFNGGSANVENVTFNNNLAFNKGSALINRDADVTVTKSTFKENGEMTDSDGTYTCSNGGAIAVEKVKNNDTKLTVKGSTFEGNKATKDGGAIHTSDSNYTNTVDATKDYQILNIDNETVFKNNKASGYFNPPENIAELTNINAKETSFTGTDKIKPDSPLNNFDINYKRDIVITYDPNDGNEVVEDKQTVNEIKDYPIKSPTDLKFTNTSKFLGWSEDKDSQNPEYQAEQKVNLTGNLYLYAIWERPAPKPSEPSTAILTLDENHRGGEITNIEVEEGDLIEPHLYIPRRRGYIFKGWSYDQKHLDEVKPGDRIYSDTTLYAIWKRAEEEKVEEPIEIKGEDHKAYIFGYPNGSVRPNGSITRAEAAAMLARLLNIEAIGSAAKPQFTDTDSSWYNKAINAVVFRGIMKGYPDGRFRPNAPITRAEFTQMISTIDNKPYGVAPFADVPGHWAERAIGSEYQAKRITGYPDGLFRPDANITRAEVAVILNKIFERKYDNLSLLKCKNPQMIKRFTDLDESFWGWNDMVEATNTHEYVRRYKEDLMKRLEEDWLLIK
ncbi:MAG: S-layer homology domain-containing protein [Eubacteriales bacterium]|uniref:S-layer homology domain-containing protein n=1 Tax=Fenollaria sp. TaxID=1965292 RepID=UPI002A74C7D5|nr:S-layer homology domain-containing protein [Fenollaria sp.]MDD7339715.1 S-layer homology domain-containing protein [Eubacteriales bacterium]MDY3106389.1 S-layer homology domain-containing protein [Fenollaria sp.]